MKSLVLVYQERHMDPSDFRKIAQRIESQTDDITVFVVNDFADSRIVADLAARGPSLTVCPFPMRGFEPHGGTVYQGKFTGKIDQMTVFADSGVRTPQWAAVTEDSTLDPDLWGPAVVVKPEFGQQGKGTKLIATERVGEFVAAEKRSGRWSRLQTRSGRMVAQGYIDTGKPLSFYRVFSVFSEVVYCAYSTCPAPAELNDLAQLPREGVSVAVSASPRHWRTLRRTESVLDLARQVHDALPERPVLGIDIVVEQSTGTPFVLEANPSGHVWHLSSRGGRKNQKTYGLDYYTQFDAMSVLTNVLIARTRSEAV